MIGHIASVQPEGDFIDVPRNMLCADVVPSAVDAALLKVHQVRHCDRDQRAPQLVGRLEELIFVAGSFHHDGEDVGGAAL